VDDFELLIKDRTIQCSQHSLQLFLVSHNFIHELDPFREIDLKSLKFS